MDDLADLDASTVDAIREAIDHQERRELQHDMRAQLAGLGDLGLPPDNGDKPAAAVPE